MKDQLRSKGIQGNWPSFSGMVFVLKEDEKIPS